MELDVLTAISPIDGRYRGKTKALAAYFSEFALIKYRVQVEVEYFITLCELPLPQLKGIDSSVFETLRNIYRNFSEADAQRIKDIESVTNHDVKAVEYFLKDERRDKLRKASGRSKYPLIRRFLNGETYLRRPQVSTAQSISCGREPGELKHLSSRRKRKQHVIP